MKKITVLVFIIAIGFPQSVSTQSIITTKHNLSVSGLGTVKATMESQICIFCHTPHGSGPKAPLWNRNDPGGAYTLYSSSTLDALPGQPDGSSILCLSCHDGTIALGDVISRPTQITMTNTLPSVSDLTTDLSNDHPVSFVYDAALAAADNQLKTPPLLNVVLDHNSKMQCTSCHDPHKETNPKFLLATKEFSALCLECHDRTYWASSTHKLSTSTWNNSGTDPWAHLELAYANVAQNACENCHDQHNANGKPRLLKSSIEENNCFDCHNSNVAAENIQVQFSKPYRHDVAAYTGIHDPTEATSVTSQHVECEDCHNPHASNASTAVAPFVNGFNLGVSGINQAGNPVAVASYTYEICYKCHAGNSWAPAPSVTRLINQNNVRLEFSTSNPSFHPVVGPRNNNEVVPNLLSPNTASTILYCTACHASNNSSDPAGPHGSINPQILKLNYETGNFVTESPTAYALCYSCHNRNNILNDLNGFEEHDKHINGEDASCAICHDPHGISSTQGNSFNNSNLINFKIGPGAAMPFNGQLRFEDTGFRSGRCWLTCHGEDHDPYDYP